jgi:hypothetical protein
MLRYSIFAFTLGLILVGSLFAQEPVRTAALPSLLTTYKRSSEAYSETFFYLGPLQEKLIGTVNTAYTDNVNLTSTNKISNLSFSLGIPSTTGNQPLNQIYPPRRALTENFYGNGRIYHQQP